jgi:2-phosphosulfolactate phosphatase
MNRVDVVPLPGQLTRELVDGRVVVVFDVLRATTTITAALAAGVLEVVLHESIPSARAAHARDPRPALLAGEEHCLPPPGFDLGNSPGQFKSEHAGKVLHMATTNGTRALLAPGKTGTPTWVLVGALVNRSAVAKACAGKDVTLLCAGTNGHPSLEDLLGCGAVLEHLPQHTRGDLASIALLAWQGGRGGIDIGAGARNVISAGLGADITYASQLDTIPLVGAVRNGTIRLL